MTIVSFFPKVLKMETGKEEGKKPNVRKVLVRKQVGNFACPKRKPFFPPHTQERERGANAKRGSIVAPEKFLFTVRD